MNDIYFEKDYASLYEEMERGSAEHWELKCEYGSISYSFLKRAIPVQSDQDYYDIISPYGYGGPVATHVVDKEKLLEQFQSEFQRYCKDNKIVSEFVRFHPLVDNAHQFDTVYHPIYMRKTVGTAIAENGDTLQLEWNQTARKLVRKAQRQGVTYRVTQAPKDLDSFLSIYHSTMDRNNASRFYYFDASYFQKCLELFGDRMLLIEVVFENTVIASCIYFIGETVLHEHLMGSLSEYLSYSPVYVLKAAAIEWATAHGLKLIHYGGGLTNSEEDPLFQFKKKFTKTALFDFYVAKKIHDPIAYKQLCAIKGVSPEEEFFPAYRK